MKIHIVQKGDTLWEIAKQYGVDFEQLKQANSQLASPDMIMPGMKIKIPSLSKHVKKEGTKKEFKKEKKEMEIKPAPKPIIQEDDKEKEKLIKPKMPTFEKPVYPVYPLPEIDQDVKGISEKKPYEKPKYEDVKPKQIKKEKPYYEYPSIPQDQHYHQPIMPCCCHVMPSCYYSVPHYPMHMPMMGCGCSHYPVHMDMSMHPNQIQQSNDTFQMQYEQYGYNYPNVPNAQLYNTPLTNNYRPTPPKFPSFSDKNNEENNDETK